MGGYEFHRERQERQRALGSSEESGPERLNKIHTQLINLRKSEGKLIALSQSQPVNSEVKDILNNSRQLFHETFNEYTKIWKYLSSHQDNADLNELMRKYITEVESYLNEPIGATSEQMIMDLGICRLYRDIIEEHRGSLLGQENDEIISRYENVEDALEKREGEINNRLSLWKAFLSDQDEFLRWLRTMERDKKVLDLPFLSLTRISVIKQKIEVLIERCPVGEQLLEEYKKKKAGLTFTTPEIKSSVTQELSLNIARFNNLQAALKTWHDHINRLVGINQVFEDKYQLISVLLSDINEQLEDRKIPTAFTDLNGYISFVKKLIDDTTRIESHIEELQSTLDEMKTSISPSDVRILTRRIWSITQRRVDLLTNLYQNLNKCQDQLDLLPLFDNKCKILLQWTEEITNKIENSPYSNLEDYRSYLDKEIQDEMDSKKALHQDIESTGNTLLDLTKGKEHKQISKLLKNVQTKWDEVWDEHGKKKLRVLDLIELKEQLEIRSGVCAKKLKELQKNAGVPIQFHEFSLEGVQEMIKRQEAEQRKINSECTEFNQLLNMGEISSSDCDNLKLIEDSYQLRLLMKNLQDLWNNLLRSFNSRKQLLNKLLSDWLKIMDDCEMFETLLSHVKTELESEIVDTKPIEGLTLEQKLDKIEELASSLKALSPKIQDFENNYFYIIREINTEVPSKLSGRVKTIVDTWHSLWELFNRKKSLLLAMYAQDFHSAEQILASVNDKLSELNANDAEDNLKHLKELKEECQPLESYEGSMKNILENEHIKNYPEYYELFSGKLNEYLGEKEKMEKLFAKLMKENTKRAQQKQVDTSVQVKTWPEEGSVGVQVKTWPEGENVGVQVKTWPVQETFTAAVQTSLLGSAIPEIIEPEIEPAVPLTRAGIYLQELEQAIQDSRNSIHTIENILSDKLGKAKINHENIVKNLASAQSSVDMVNHLRRLLTEEEDTPLEESKEKEIQDLLILFQSVAERARLYNQQLREASPSKSKVTCPVCSPKQRGAWDGLLWRLEQWLTYAEANLQKAMRKRPPTALEELEDVILVHRELLLDLDSHRSLVKSLKEVSDHLGEHDSSVVTVDDFDGLNTRLRKTIDWWNKVCHNAASWQARLQIALQENSDFHLTIEEYEEFVNITQEKVQELEPVDLTDGRESIRRKYKIFKDLRDKISRKEPEVRTLKRTAEQLFINPKMIEKGKLDDEESDSVFVTADSERILERITTILQELNFLSRVCGAYVKYLSGYATHDRLETVDEDMGQVLRFSEDILDGRSSPARSATPQPIPSHDNNQSSAIVRGGRYIGRVVRASLPIQALILLLLGAASLIPYGEQDYSCTTANNFARSLEPMLNYPDGPPTI